MKRPSIYLAGPINARSDEEVFGWRQEARQLLTPGWDIKDPADRDFRGLEDVAVDAIVEGDIAEIEGCEVLLAYAVTPSVGTSMEVLLAHQVGKPSPWLVYHADGVERSLSSAGWRLADFHREWCEVNR